MSGYLHTGMTFQQYADREAIRAAVEVMRRRWPDCEYEIDAVEALGEGIDDGE